MISFIRSIAITLVVCAAFGCSKDDALTAVPDPLQEQPQSEDPVAVPTLSTISPTNGPKTTIVTIKGQNFGTDPDDIKVFFNEKEAEVIAVQDEEIKTKVPVQAYSGAIRVVIGESSLTGPEFNYVITDVLVGTFAGNGSGYADGIGEEARFDRPNDMVLDAFGNAYVADTYNNRIRKISPEGEVTTFAGGMSGTADGVGTAAQFRQPHGIAIDANGNLYVADTKNHRIRKIEPSGLVTTLAGSDSGIDDGPGIEAKFSSPRGVAVGPDGNIYIADTNSHRIRMINAEGEVSTIAGSGFGYTDGPAADAKFKFPRGLVLDQAGNVFIADTDSHIIRKLSTDGIVSTFAGEGHPFYADGNGIEAGFNLPDRLTIDNQGNLYVIDTYNFKIRKISPEADVSTLAGGDRGFENGTSFEAQFDVPSGIAVNPTGMFIYVADTNNHRIRLIVQD